jgi:hypothetical protein
MVEAAPAPSFKMTEPNLLFELLIIALDPPAQLGEIDQTGQRHVLWKGREPVLGRLLVALGPFDEKPLFGSGRGAIVIAMRRPDAQASKP